MSHYWDYWTIFILIQVVNSPVVKRRNFNPEDPGSIPGLGSGISEILFVVFPRLSDRVDRMSFWLKLLQDLCIDAILVLETCLFT